MKVSLFYGKKCESTAGRQGYVISVNASGMKLVSLTCADDGEREFTVDIKNVKGFKSKIYFTEGKRPAETGTPLRLGKPVYDCEGNFVGKLTDFTVENDKITFAHVGSKKFSAKDMVCGDAVIIKNSAGILKDNVKKNGKVIIKRGTPLSDEICEKARRHGEYVQTKLKTI